MKNVLINALAICLYSYAQAGVAQKAVNFPPEKRLGQFNFKKTITVEGTTQVENSKICFLSYKSIDMQTVGLPGCTVSIVLDTATELKSNIVCKDDFLTTTFSKRISENKMITTFESRGVFSITEQEYVGSKCDSDAVRI